MTRFLAIIIIIMWPVKFQVNCPDRDPAKGGLRQVVKPVEVGESFYAVMSNNLYQISGML